MTFCKRDILKPDLLKPDILKPVVLKPDVLWVYRTAVLSLFKKGNFYTISEDLLFYVQYNDLTQLYERRRSSTSIDAPKGDLTRTSDTSFRFSGLQTIGFFFADLGG
jgi:hypothetical protein